MVYIRTYYNTWESLYRSCKENNIELADIIIHTKYPVNCERLFAFSETVPQGNINCGLLLSDYNCKEVVFNDTKYEMFTDEEWQYLYPYLQENNLLNKPINFFYRELEPVQIYEVITNTRKIYFYSNYCVHLVYRVENDLTPVELSDLFLDNGACINSIYIKNYKTD